MKFLLFLIQTDAAVPQQFEECSPSTEAMFQTLRLVPGGKISVCVRRTLQRGSAMTTGSLENVSSSSHGCGRAENVRFAPNFLSHRLHTNPASWVPDVTSAVTF